MTSDFSHQETAIQLGVHPYTVTKYRARGLLPFYVNAQGHYRYFTRGVLELQRKRRQWRRSPAWAGHTP